MPRPMLQNFKACIVQFFKDERGSTALEYALICGLIFLAIIVAVRDYATNVGKTYSKIGNAIDSVM